MNTPVVTLKTNHPLCVRPLLSISSARSNAKRLETDAIANDSPIFSNLCCRNSSLQASRLMSPKLDERPAFNEPLREKRQCVGKTRQRGHDVIPQSTVQRPSIGRSSSTRARHPQCVRFLPQPLPMSASCRPCHNCPKLTVAPPRPQRLPREGDPADQETEHGAGSDRIERCAPYRSPR